MAKKSVTVKTKTVKRTTKKAPVKGSRSSENSVSPAYGKEFYDAVRVFENYARKSLYLGNSGLEKESMAMWKKGYFYCNGGVNDAFKAFMYGVSYGSHVCF